FLDYYREKEQLDKLEKEAAFTLDMATIASSGGLALATKVSWVRRAWAVIEVAGAVGNIVANISQSKHANNHFVQAVHYYNAVMGAIGLGNIAQMGYRAVKSLPRNAKSNAKLMKNYELWQKEVAQLDHLPQAEKQLIDKQREVLKGLELTNEGRGVENLIKTVNTEQKLLKNGKFIDELLEADYQKYLARKSKESKSARDRLSWKEERDYWLYDSPMARGNEFNKKAEKIYDFNEIHLENGKRLDSYIPPTIDKRGMIISRKATDLENIELSTFESYLKEMKSKYSSGTTIRSNKYSQLDGKKLEGNLYLEIPESNKNFSEIEKYKKIARKYDIEIIFLKE
ncbi:hemagglutinin/hemolysin family protein, partial [Capnocytophaga sp. oral taxon 338 str. F0234]